MSAAQLVEHRDRQLLPHSSRSGRPPGAGSRCGINSATMPAGPGHELKAAAIGPITDVRVSTHPDVEITLTHPFLDMASVVSGRLGLLKLATTTEREA